MHFAMSTTSFVWACTWNMCGLPVFIRAHPRSGFGGPRTRATGGRDGGCPGPGDYLWICAATVTCTCRS